MVSQRRKVTTSPIVPMHRLVGLKLKLWDATVHFRNQPVGSTFHRSWNKVRSRCFRTLYDMLRKSGFSRVYTNEMLDEIAIWAGPTTPVDQADAHLETEESNPQADNDNNSSDEDDDVGSDVHPNGTVTLMVMT